MPKVYSIDGIVPVVHPSAFVHPSAVLIGDVIVGARAYIGPAAGMLHAVPGKEVEALTEVEKNRKRIDILGAIPLSELKKQHA